MFNSKHRIEVFMGSDQDFYWRARYIGPGPMKDRIVADGSQGYSTRSNARRAARRIGRVLMFAPIVDSLPRVTNGDYRRG